MADTSKIEWTDATWNVVTGCEKVSPGCDNCYAETFAERWRGTPGHHFENGFDVTLRPERITLPLRWRKPKRVFVNSMSDLFHKDIPDEYIARVFATMSLTPQHTYQILTKRHGRMRSLLNDPNFEKQVDHELLHFPPFADPKQTRRPWPLPKPGWPLPNVWMGVSVEDQQRADLRIPALVDTPAAVRFLSCEPLLGPIDLTKHLGGAHGVEEPRGRRVLGGSGRRVDHRQSGADLESGCAQERPLERGNEDDSLQAQASGARHGDVLSGPRHEGPGPLLRAGAQAGMAALHGADTAGPDGEPQERQQAGQPSGEPGTGDSLGASSARPASIEAGPPGSVRDAQLDGEADTRRGSADQAQAVSWRDAGVDRRGLSDQDAARLAHREGHASISWVICGGESGPKARPMHPDWARGLRNQCALAGVPYLFKQWGTWGVDSPLDDQGRLLTTRRGLGVTVANDGTVYQPGDLAYPDGPRYGEAVRAGHDKAHLTAMYRLGKKEAGRELDGRTHDAFPAVTA